MFSIQTSDGGYAFGGNTSTFGAGGSDIYLAKIDSSGNSQWEYTIGGSGNDFGYALVQTSDEGYAIAGVTNSGGAGNDDVYVVKLDGSGNLQWTRTIGGTGMDRGYSIIQANDGGYIICGMSDSFGASNGHAYVIKLYSTGNIEWTRLISNSFSANAIVRTNDNGYAISGTGTFNSSGLISKFDSTDNLQWTYAFGNGNCFSDVSLVQTYDSGYAMLVYCCNSPLSHPEYFVLRLTGNGILQWAHTLDLASNGCNSGSNFGYSIIQTSDSGFAFSGNSIYWDPAFSCTGISTFYITKLNKYGNYLWSNNILDGEGCNIIQTKDNGFAMTGLGSNGICFLKLDSNVNGCCHVISSLHVISENTLGVSGGNTSEILTTIASLPDSVGTVNAGGSLVTVCSNSALPMANIEANDSTTRCQGQNVLLQVYGTVCGVSLQWQKNAVDIPGAIGLSYNAVTTGDYSCVITNSVGSAISNTITVHILPSPSVIASSSNLYYFVADTLSNLLVLSFCSGDSVTLTCSPAASYLWGPSNDTTQSIIISTSDVRWVTITNDSNACSATWNILPARDSLPRVVVNGSSTFCFEGYIDLNAYSGGVSTLNQTYQWQLNGNDIAGAIHNYYSEYIDTSGNYTCVVSNSCGINTSNAITAEVNPLPMDSLTADGLTTFCSGDSITQSSNLFPNYFWSTSDSSQSITVYDSGDYFVTVTDSNGCSTRSDTIFVFVSICDAISNLSSVAFSATISPNPTRDHITLNISSKDPSHCLFILHDLTGREIERQIDLPISRDFTFGKNLSNGFYFAEVIQGSNRQIIRLIKD